MRRRRASRDPSRPPTTRHHTRGSRSSTRHTTSRYRDLRAQRAAGEYAARARDPARHSHDTPGHVDGHGSSRAGGSQPRPVRGNPTDHASCISTQSLTRARVMDAVHIFNQPSHDPHGQAAPLQARVRSLTSLARRSSHDRGQNVSRSTLPRFLAILPPCSHSTRNKEYRPTAIHVLARDVTPSLVPGAAAAAAVASHPWPPTSSGHAAAYCRTRAAMSPL
jgi:hypothetical protein